MRVLQSFLIAAGAAVLAGCGAEPSGTGTASFSITDAPVDDVDRVQVTFDRIDLNPADGPPITIELDEPRVVDDLLDLQGNDAELILGPTAVDAGRYSWLRLFVVSRAPDSFVVEEGGGQVDLIVPGQQSSANPNRRFVQLSSPFVVPVGGDVDFTIDVGLRKALTKPDGKNHYLLRPALRLVDNSEVGTVTGTVADQLVNAASCTNQPSADEGNAVYLYDDADASPGDIQVDESGDPVERTGEDNPLTTANVKQNADTGAYEYTIGFVAEGEYTVAFTCQALDDDPALDDALALEQPANVTVEDGQKTEHDFTVQ